MAKKTGPAKNVPGGSSKTVTQHKRLAMGQPVTGQKLKHGGSVEKSKGGRGCA
jgi:hypothetical protein